MNFHIILFKLLLSLTVASTPSATTPIGFNDLIVKKQSYINPQARAFAPFQTIKPSSSGSVMHKVSNIQELAIFCKMEHELMKASGFAIKFRLGDQSFVDQLEGK